MDDLDHREYSLHEAAFMSGVPFGTLSSWRHRHEGMYVQGYDVMGVCGLSLVGHLTRDLRVNVQAAAAIAHLARDSWPDVLAELGRREAFLLARPGTRDDPRWDVAVVDEPTMRAHRCPGALIVNLSLLAQAVADAARRLGDAA